MFSFYLEDPSFTLVFFFFNKDLLTYIFSWKAGQQTERQRDKQVFHLLAHSQWPQQWGLGQAKARTQEFHRSLSQSTSVLRLDSATSPHAQCQSLFHISSWHFLLWRTAYLYFFDKHDTGQRDLVYLCTLMVLHCVCSTWISNHCWTNKKSAILRNLATFWVKYLIITTTELCILKRACSMGS